MSYIQLDGLSPEDLIVQYVVECRGKGHFLPYLDYQIIGEWLKAASDPDELLVVLSDCLPVYFAGSDNARPKPLSGAKKRVLRALRDRALRHGPEQT